VRKADRAASWFAVFVGIVGIYLGIFTSSGFGTVIALIAVYLTGTVFLFFRSLSREDRADLETMEVTYGKTYWGPLIAGCFIAVGLGVFYFTKFEPQLASAILVGLGLMSALTAFVSPEFNVKTRLDNADEFG